MRKKIEEGLFKIHQQELMRSQKATQRTTKELMHTLWLWSATIASYGISLGDLPGSQYIWWDILLILTWFTLVQTWITLFQKKRAKRDYKHHTAALQLWHTIREEATKTREENTRALKITHHHIFPQKDDLTGSNDSVTINDDRYIIITQKQTNNNQHTIYVVHKDLIQKQDPDNATDKNTIQTLIQDNKPDEVYVWHRFFNANEPYPQLP